MRVTSDRLPLTSARVDAQRDTKILAFIHHGLNEVHVVRSGGRPVLSAFHINPEHAHGSSQSGVSRSTPSLLRTKAEVMRAEIAHRVIHLYQMNKN